MIIDVSFVLQFVDNDDGLVGCSLPVTFQGVVWLTHELHLYCLLAFTALLIYSSPCCNLLIFVCYKRIFLVGLVLLSSSVRF